MRERAIVALITLCPTLAHAQDESNNYEPPSPFDQGSISASLALSFATTSSFNSTRTYIIAGGGIGYFVLDGVELGFDVEHWFTDGNFDITKVSPGVRYVVYQTHPLHPYAGVFYRHWFYHNALVDDADTVGARAGVIYTAGQIWLGLGAMFEYQVSDCTRCGTWSPELSLGIAF